AGREVVVTREPGGTPVGDAIRSVLLGSGDYDMLPQTEAFLLSAARAQHVHDVIRPGITRGAVVLCDRFADSSLAYQGGGRGMATSDLRCLERLAVGDTTPDLRILLDLPVEEGLERRHRDADTVNRIDRADLGFHRRVRDTYLHLVEANPDEWAVIDASRSPDAVQQDICRVVGSVLAISLVPPGAERQV
ncbi:MAG TPA: dTMP kinase, partial [Thermomicrobiales bacterium]|nr:dTMP kinase [Thermomicrobiales bacterium]